MAGLFSKINQNPGAASMMLMGLGLLGSKKRSQADRYIGGFNNALVNQAALKQQQQARQAELDRTAPMRQAELDRLKAQTNLYNAQAGAEGAPGGMFQGSGASVQAMNIVTKLGSKIQSGQPLTPQEQMAFQTARNYLSQQRTTFGPGGQPVQSQMDVGYLPDLPQAGPSPQAPVGQSPAVPSPASPPAPTTQSIYPETPGQIAVDKKMADEYVNWTTGGYADVEKSMTQLYGALGNLESGKVETGDLQALGTSLLPDKWASFLRPDFMQTKEAVEEVAQRNLRLILGAQFAEKEGERLISRAYNPNIETKKNAERVRRLTKQIGDAAQAKQKAMDYYGKKGTLKGFAPGITSFADLQTRMEKDFLAGVYEGDPDTEWDIPDEGITYDPVTGKWSDQ